MDNKKKRERYNPAVHMPVFFLTKHRADGAVEHQGHVLAWEGGCVYAQLYSWVTGYPTDTKRIKVSDWDWEFFDNPDDWVAAGDRARDSDKVCQ